MHTTPIKDYFGLGDFFHGLFLYESVIQPNSDRRAWYEFQDPVTEVVWWIRLSPRFIRIYPVKSDGETSLESNFPVRTVEDVELYFERAGLNYKRKAATLPGKSSCNHPKPKDAGVYGDGMGTVHVEWCPDCGALHRQMINWKYTDSGWEMPQAMEELKHDLDLVRDYLRGEWARGALSGPMSDELINIMNKEKLCVTLIKK